MELNINNPNELPYNSTSNKKWSFFYAYNLRTIRDIFVIVSRMSLNDHSLYELMDSYEIKPPKDKWSLPTSNDKQRLKLEYLHGTQFLGLIKKKSTYLEVDLDEFRFQKEAILDYNKGRIFKNEKSSPKLSEEEINAFLPIILNYTRAREYLWWFLDFSKFRSDESFSIEDFRQYAKPIFLNQGKDQKGAEIIYREIDKQYWKIPFEETIVDNKIKRTNDYTRPVSYVFPSWFKELNIINRLPILKEFGFKEGTWELHYPLKKNNLNLEQFEEFLLDKFNNKLRRINVVWIPNIIYEATLTFQIPIEEIKKLIIQLYEQKRPKYIMERSSLQVMRYSKNLRRQNRHQDLFINYNHFNRNNLIINN